MIPSSTFSDLSFALRDVIVDRCRALNQPRAKINPNSVGFNQFKWLQARWSVNSRICNYFKCLQWEEIRMVVVVHLCGMWCVSATFIIIFLYCVAPLL